MSISHKDYGSLPTATLQRLYDERCLALAAGKPNDDKDSKLSTETLLSNIRQDSKGFLILRNAMQDYLTEYPLVADSKVVTKVLARMPTGIKGNHEHADNIIKLYSKTILPNFANLPAEKKQRIIESVIKSIKKDIYAVLLKNQTAHGSVGSSIKAFLEYYRESLTPDLPSPAEACATLDRLASQYMQDNPPLGSYSVFAYVGAKGNYPYAQKIHNTIVLSGFKHAKDEAQKEALINEILPEIGKVYLDMRTANITSGQVITMVTDFYAACKTPLPEVPEQPSMFSSFARACGAMK